MKRIATTLAFVSVALFGCASTESKPVDTYTNVPADCLLALDSADRIAQIQTEFSEAWVYMNETADADGTAERVRELTKRLNPEVTIYIVNRDNCREAGNQTKS